jgi:hypothetical protein
MLRLFVLLLLVANGGFFAWSRGYLNQFGFASASKNESFRLAEQLEPERIVITTSTAAPSTAPVTPLTAPITASTPTPASSAPTVVTTCLTAGAFNDRQSTLLRQMLNNKLPDMRWRFDTVNIPARWIVYMGKYPNENARELKKKQLDQIKVRYEALTESNLEPGLSLGSYETQAMANLALQQLLKQGVRTARVLQESPEQKAQTLVAPAVDDAMREALNTAYATIAVQLANKSLQVCKN